MHTKRTLPARIHTVDYCPLLANKVCFDTNVWIKIYGLFQGPRNSENVAKEYASLYTKIITVGGKIFTNYLILQEYFNVFVNDHMVNFKRKNPSFNNLNLKEFKTLAPINFCNAISSVKLNFEQILSNSIIEEVHGPTNIDILDHLDRCITEAPLLNDLEIIRICKAQNYFLATHDGDFKDSPIKIISSNSAIFSPK